MGFFERYYRRPQQILLRKVNFQFHLWIGIVVTLYMILIGVTGSILVFRAELERSSGAKPWQELRAQPPFADLATVVANLQSAYPRARVVSVEAPSAEEATFVAVVEGRRRVKVACAPKDGRVLGIFPPGPRWLQIVDELHVSLMAHRAGRVLNGIGGALLLILNVTGMVVWWPGIRNWARALKVDFRRNWRRVNWDLHSAVGFWTILISTFWAVSGIYFAWPRQTFVAVNSISPIVSARVPAITVEPEYGGAEPDLREMTERARQMDPGTALAGIAFPYGRRAPLGILMRRREAPGREYTDTVYFNPYNGAYLSTWRYGVNQSFGDWIIWSQVPLHFGTYWGFTVKVIWAAAGLAIPLLTVTGLLMYWNRFLRKKWKRRHKAVESAAGLARNHA